MATFINGSDPPNIQKTGKWSSKADIVHEQLSAFASDLSTKISISIQISPDPTLITHINENKNPKKNRHHNTHNNTVQKLLNPIIHSHTTYRQSVKTHNNTLYLRSTQPCNTFHGTDRVTRLNYARTGTHGYKVQIYAPKRPYPSKNLSQWYILTAQ